MVTANQRKNTLCYGKVRGSSVCVRRLSDQHSLISHVLCVAASGTAEPTAWLTSCLGAPVICCLALYWKRGHPYSELLTSKASFDLLPAEKQTWGLSSWPEVTELGPKPTFWSQTLRPTVRHGLHRNTAARWFPSKIFCYQLCANVY